MIRKKSSRKKQYIGKVCPITKVELAYLTQKGIRLKISTSAVLRKAINKFIEKYKYLLPPHLEFKFNQAMEVEKIKECQLPRRKRLGLL